MDDTRLADIIERLERYEQAATYGAVAGVIGVNPRSVMKTRTRSFTNSWIVSKQSRRPTGYRPCDWHPRLLAGIAANGVIETAEGLTAWLGCHP
jgi:hypothetical protein